MDKPNEEIITLKSEMRDMAEDIRRLKISMMDIQKRLLILGKEK